MNKSNAKRIVRTAGCLVNAPAGSIFPLLCPVREYDWIPGWKCEMVYSESGLIERDCIFTTMLAGLSKPEVWTVSRYDPAGYRLGFIRVAQECCVTHMEISLDPRGESGTWIEAGKVFTSLGPEGDAFIDDMTDAAHAKWLRGLGALLDHYLATGVMALQDTI